MPYPVMTPAVRWLTALASGLLLNLALVMPAPADCLDYAVYPHLIGTVDTRETPQRVALSGSLLCAASSNNRLQLVDVSDPESPLLRGALEVVAEDVAVRGNLAYVASGSDGLHVVDISNPDAPVVLATLTTSDPAMGIDFAGDFAVLACSSGGLQIVLISDPLHPRRIASLATPGFPRRVKVDGAHAYLVEQGFGVEIVDLSAPRNPTVVASIPHAPSYFTAAVAVTGGLAAVASSPGGEGVAGRLDLYDVTDPASPRILGSADTAVRSYASSVEIGGGHAFVIGGGAFQVFDLADPAHPSEAVSAMQYGYDLVISETVAFIGAPSRVDVLDLGQMLTPPPTLGHFPLDLAYSVETSGSFALVGGAGVVSVLDVSDPSAPVLLGRCATGDPRFINWVTTIAGDHAYTIDTSALNVIDLSNPANPVLASRLVFGDASGVAVSGDHAYVAGHASGLHVVDISNPANPVIVTTLPTPFLVNRIAESGGFACLVGPSPSQLAIVDVRDPANPVLTGGIGLEDYPEDVCVSGHYAFVAEWGQGTALQVIDISDPYHPRVVPGAEVPQAAGDVSIRGNVLYLTGGGNGFVVVDITDPENPRVIGLSAVFPAQCMAAAADDQALYVADRDGGLYALPRQCDATTGVATSGSAPAAMTVQVSPVPSAGATRIHLAGVAAGRAVVEVFEVSGRAVARFEDARAAAGERELGWDGRNTRGAEVPPGIYFVRASLGTTSAVSRIVLIR